jgi:hypothetical protein
MEKNKVKKWTEMMKAKYAATLILLVTIIFATVPSLTISAAYLQKPEKKAENYVALADKAKEQVQNLIDLIYANATALEKINEAGLTEALEGNVTLFNQGVGNLTAAHDALNATDYEGAIANATSAFKIFRQVFIALHIILDKSGVPKGQLVDAQGLIEAMERSLERIEKLKELNITEEVQEMLDNATVYLNIETARIWLQEGRVKDVVWNLTQANWLIAKANVLIIRNAQIEKINARMRFYFKGLNQTCERIMGRLHNAEDKGFNVTDMLEQMGYENMEQFQQHLQEMMEEAEQNLSIIRNAMQNLNRISANLRQIDRDLTIQMAHQRQGNRKP